MTKRKITKIDPREELSPYLNHQYNQQNKRKENKVSASLHGLRAERKKSLIKRLGSILTVSLLAVIGLGYYISPLTNIESVEIKGAADIPTKSLVKTSGIKVSDRVFDYQFRQKNLQKKLAKQYPEVKRVNVRVDHWNHLILKVNEYPTIAYLKDGDRYRKILANGKVGSYSLPWSKVAKEKPLFVGYSHKISFKQDLKLFDSFPSSFRNKVKLLSGNATRANQIVLIMKDGNVVIGNTATLKDKIKYYDAIKTKAGKDSLIDFEVGAYSRPLTANEKKAYGIS